MNTICIHNFLKTLETVYNCIHATPTLNTCDHYRVDVSQRDKLGAIGVAKAEQGMKVK